MAAQHTFPDHCTCTNQPKGGVVAALRNSLETSIGRIRRRRQIARSREDLTHLDDRLLADIGVTREAAGRETVKSFWE